MAQQPARSPCQWVGRLQDVSGMDQGPGRGVQESWWLLAGPGHCQSLRISSFSVPPKECWKPADLGGWLCWPPREEEKKMGGGGSDPVAGSEEKALSWGSGPFNTCCVTSGKRWPFLLG